MTLTARQAAEAAKPTRKKVLRPVERLSYGVDDAAEALGFSPATVWAMLREGELESFKWHGRTLISREVLEAALAQAQGKAA